MNIEGVQDRPKEFLCQMVVNCCAFSSLSPSCLKCGLTGSSTIYTKYKVCTTEFGCSALQKKGGTLYHALFMFTFMSLF